MDDKQGHYCCEWDMCWITNEYPEFDCCLCFELEGENTNEKEL